MIDGDSAIDPDEELSLVISRGDEVRSRADTGSAYGPSLAEPIPILNDKKSTHPINEESASEFRVKPFPEQEKEQAQNFDRSQEMVKSSSKGGRSSVNQSKYQDKKSKRSAKESRTGESNKDKKDHVS